MKHQPTEEKVIVLSTWKLKRELQYAQKELDMLYVFAINHGIHEAGIPPHVRLKKYIKEIGLDDHE